MKYRNEASLAITLLLGTVGVLLMVMAWNGCTTVDGERKFDQCEALSVAKGAHSVADGASMIVCSAIADPAKKAKCYQYQKQAAGIGSLIVNLGVEVLKACGI